ncbi:uncharacterized protein LOC8284192 [Ricinus communis]|uniref:uncharacterized protein LOC8284192 n=1 Tax=Ricinus communis TaxID=3988 RepID=UPI00201ADAB7|nr:uncharacterized protein LOC8284192 [Ricinus communis]XP_025012975.2 uncharacterized protein LOC8284192 [Ricinus communis]XP_048230292.1 uncharacterized protein LOC8284192 [Ricinus communis]
MADWHGMMGNNSVGGYSRRSMRDEDFEEEDIWSVVKEREDSSPKIRKSKDNYCSSSPSSSAWRLHSAPRMIPRANIVSPTSAGVPATSTHEAKAVQQSSAPVNIPDWSKIYGKNTRMGSWANNDDDDDDDDGIVYDDGEDHGHVNGNGYYYNYNNNNVDVNGNDDEEDEMVPPHEWIAKKLARSQISSFSVCEGIGRTLKGRDLSKVRNAILAKTGFLE